MSDTTVPTPRTNRIEGVRQRGKTWTWKAMINGRQVQKGGFPSAKAAKAARAQALADAARGNYVEPTKTTIRDFVEGGWFTGLKSTLRPLTVANYQGLLNLYILPGIGDVVIQKLTASQLDRFYQALREGGGKGGRPLGETTIEHVHRLIHKILKAAVARDIVARNVSERLDTAPRRGDTEIEFWTAEQTSAFLQVTKDRRQWPIWVLVATAGLRRGEVAGLRWSDVDLGAGTVTVRKSRVVVGGKDVHEQAPKSRRGQGAAKVRVVEIGPATVAALQALKARQDDERLAAGEVYETSGYVAVDEIGRPVFPESLSQSFNRAVAWARRPVESAWRQGGGRDGGGLTDLPAISFHGLRHSAASALLEMGVHLKVVSERLGHSNTAITAEIYSHVAPRLHSEAAALADQALLGASQRRTEQLSATGYNPNRD